MSVLSNLIKKVAPIVATVSPEPISRSLATGLSSQYQQQAISYQRNLAIDQQKAQERRAMEIFGTQQGINRIQAPITSTTTATAGFGSGFGQFLGDVGRNIISPFAGIATQLAPFFGRSEVQQPAVSTIRRGGAQESQQSGSQEAFIGGGGIAPLLNIGRQFLRSPVGQIGTGTAVGGLVGALGGTSQPSMRITRKMKSQARMVLNMTGGNLSAAADILGIDENTLVFILLKRFRNDGPVVTKAALRKTKQTVRRLKSMCDMYDDLKPRATARRRAPMRRSTTTLIKN
jgi:hypothetical protein